jgi:hypothetical protein
VFLIWSGSGAMVAFVSAAAGVGALALSSYFGSPPATPRSRNPSSAAPDVAATSSSTARRSLYVKEPDLKKFGEAIRGLLLWGVTGSQIADAAVITVDSDEPRF